MKLAALVPGLALAGCGGSKTLLSPKDPTMLSIWHVYGEQADSPMNRLLTEFNDTVGREKGILLNVTNMTNSAAIGGQLQDAKAGKPGALDLPDLFSAHSADASALGIENLVDWNDWFTAEDMAAYVPGFVQDGIIDGKQVVFPVSKSTQLIFLNGSQYARFAADTGAQLSSLATWDGFFEMAGAYRQWSQGKPFCALDYPLRLVELNALEQGSGELYKGSWYDLTNETFRKGQCYTKFIDETPELFDISESRNRGNKLLEYIGNIVVNDPQAGAKMYEPPRVPEVAGEIPAGYKQYLDQHGPEALSKLVLGEKKLLVCDTTMRDAHQSLLATRVRTRDIVKGMEGTSEILADAFSLECWGGATFDVAYRFLHESPWERLDLIRQKAPNLLLQMLLRGANAVGYTNYPDNVIREFIKEAARSGIDVFRIFDSLNWIPGMEVAMDEVLKQDKICQATICYTGDILDPKRDKYTLDYYVKMAKELEHRGAHMLAIKDMSGLLKPYAAKKLVSTLKQEIGIPIQLHTHDTTGNQVAALLLAAEAGVDAVDCAISSMAGMTSQPSLNAVVAAMKDTERDTGLDLDRLQTLTDYWEDVRKRYDSFEGGLEYNTTDIYRYEIPGGQYTNLKPQVESLGLGDRFVEVKENYRKVNEMVGDIVKVTPSSKMVGDLAIFMTQNNLTPENIVEKGESLAFPDSVVSYFSGMMGQPAGGFPKDLQRGVLKGKKPITCRPGELLPPVDFEEKKREMQSFDADPSWRAILSYCLYPKVVEDYVKNQKEYGYIMRLGSHVFFHGLAVGETNKVNIADGKTLVIKYLGLGEVDKEGMRTVSFELNGIRRDVQVPDEEAQKNIVKVPMADPEDKSQVGSSIPGAVSRLNVKVGDTVEKNQTLVTIEAMKMETAITARMSGTVSEILVKEGETVKGGQLILVIK